MVCFNKNQVSWGCKGGRKGRRKGGCKHYKLTPPTRVTFHLAFTSGLISRRKVVSKRQGGRALSPTTSRHHFVYQAGERGNNWLETIYRPASAASTNEQSKWKGHRHLAVWVLPAWCTTPTSPKKGGPSWLEGLLFDFPFFIQNKTHPPPLHTQLLCSQNAQSKRAVKTRSYKR